MNKLALQLPGGNIVSPPPDLKKDFVDLASLLTPLLNIVIYIAVFLTYYYQVLGELTYIMAQGKKEKMTNYIVGREGFVTYEAAAEYARKQGYGSDAIQDNTPRVDVIDR